MPFQEVAEAHVVVFGETFQDFEQTLLDADACLDALDDDVGFSGRATLGHGTSVPYDRL